MNQLIWRERQFEQRLTRRAAKPPLSEHCWIQIQRCWEPKPILIGDAIFDNLKWPPPRKTNFQLITRQPEIRILNHHFSMVFELTDTKSGAHFIVAFTGVAYWEM